MMREWVAGVDEAGRGPLAGPVCAAAVILRADDVPAGIGDSKTIAAAQRLDLARVIEARALASAVAFASVAEIDRVNILQASLLAMRRAVESLSVAPASVLIDGNRCPEGLRCPARALVGGDRSERSIGAASILAKVARDLEMERLDGLYPGYGFARHRGYPTAQHLRALDRLGPCAIHRRSFAPVRRRLACAGAARSI